MFLYGVISGIISISSIEHAHVFNFYVNPLRCIYQRINLYSRSFSHSTYLTNNTLKPPLIKIFIQAYDLENSVMIFNDIKTYTPLDKPVCICYIFFATMQIEVQKLLHHTI
jgi:hypothetical protein